MATTEDTTTGWQSDQGTAYGTPAGSSETDLIEVEAGTPTGEMLRRYWHPFATAATATSTPTPVRILGEDLILFRTGLGEVGLVQPRCCHRGTTLYYGKVEDDGIRCCYHGWLFAPDGQCVDMPVEPDRGQGLPESRQAMYRQPWYPVREYHGMLFAYLGPPEHKPVFPTYDIFDNVPEGFEIVADDNNIGLEGDRTPCNWFQTHENVMDPFHVFVLHAGFSGNQFVAEMAALPLVDWEFTDQGVKSYQDRQLENGDWFHRVTECVMPNVRIVASPFVETYGSSNSVAWTLPISRTETKIFTLMIRPVGAPRIRAQYDGKTWPELTEEEHQRFPGDYEAQVGQGDVTWHNQENLAASDRGVGMIRHVFRQQVRAVADGEQPVGVVPM
ncbi:MAG: phenylpropionate dioxygenase-like ring-hydroxylating dioxygenase large terminal subunit, partial [Candidatus Poriferisodalaceae bacterium]